MKWLCCGLQLLLLLPRTAMSTLLTWGGCFSSSSHAEPSTEEGAHRSNQISLPVSHLGAGHCPALPCVSLFNKGCRVCRFSYKVVP